MAKVLISELSGPALNWAVADIDGGVMHFEEDGTIKLRGKKFDPINNAAHAHSIIENDIHSLTQTEPYGQDTPFKWEATIYMNENYVATEYGPSSLIAAMRCKVSSTTMENWVEIPDELAGPAPSNKRQERQRG
jgi:hypothetical protein